MTDRKPTGAPVATAGGPLAGISVVEVARGVSELGVGLAGGLPGMVFGALGATVLRVVSPAALPIDAAVQWGRVWHRGKELVAIDDPAEIADLVVKADVAFVYGGEALVEQAGLGWLDLHGRNPELVYTRCRPSVTSAGELDDYALLVEARAGFCTQLPGHREGPILVDVRAGGSGAAFLLTASALALLRARAVSGVGGWAEASLYDGMLATLGCMIGRSERAPREIEQYWEKGSWFPNFLYRCADGELIQVWFGGKGMYDKLIAVLGDEPSEAGYYADQSAGRLNDRAIRWRELFMKRPRAAWIEQLRAAGVACEPVLGPGEALTEPHLIETGMAVRAHDDGHDDLVTATPLTVTPVEVPESARRVEPKPGSRGLLEGVRVVDFSMFVAGPLAAEVLADLGAEVIKVEPPTGEAMRGAAYALAACQRGKRDLAIDIHAPEAKPVVERLLRWADVVLHNFRVGVSERLGIDEETVKRLNPGAVYCHASAFGGTGPRAQYPGNDALMQAVTGFEHAVGGEGNDPIAATWIPIDVSGGWIAASGILAGLYARAVTGAGQRIATSLLGAGMLLQSGAFWRDGELVRGPHLDANQTGYGPGYRLYEAGNGEWLAVVVPTEGAWAALRALPELAGIGDEYLPLRLPENAGAAAAAEAAFEAGLRTAPAADWAKRLTAAGALVEPVARPGRDGFRRGILDDPVNRAVGRVVAYPTVDWGGFEQIGPLLRTGPMPAGKPMLRLPAIGHDSSDVLLGLGCSEEEVDALLTAKVVTQFSS